MPWEVEQKFPVADVALLEAKLAELGAAPGDPQTQVDRYFAHPARDFARTDEALRIRRVGNENFVTYKGPKVDAVTKTRREIELPLPGGDAGAHDFAELLAALGFRPVAEVRKRRRRALVSWRGRQVEVALDEVEGLGSFVELELESNDAGLAEARECIASLASRLGLAGSERRSYLELLLARRDEPQRSAPLDAGTVPHRH